MVFYADRGLGEVIVCGVLGSLLRVALKKYRNTLFHEKSCVYKTQLLMFICPLSEKCFQTVKGLI